MTLVTTVTTETAPSKDQFAYWREVVCQHFIHVRPEWAGDGSFHAEIRAETIGNLTVSRVTSAGQRVFRTQAEIARSPIPLYLVNIQVEGASSFRQGAKERTLSCGDIFILDSLREFEMGCERPFSHLAIPMPKDWLDARLARPDLIAGAVVRRDHPLSRVLTAYLLNGFETAQELSPAAAAMMADHTVELLARILGESQPGALPPSSAWRAALYVRACRIIGLCFGDSHLTPDRIARELGVSTRLLQRTFADRNETVMRRLWEERVSHAANLLVAPEAMHRSITDIAFACGFNDSSHFGRVFASRMGMTPSHWRKQAR
jgi:AraC family transcriptional activator of tynA and feaB